MANTDVMKRFYQSRFNPLLGSAFAILFASDVLHATPKNKQTAPQTATPQIRVSRFEVQLSGPFDGVPLQDERVFGGASLEAPPVTLAYISNVLAPGERIPKSYLTIRRFGGSERKTSCVYYCIEDQPFYITAGVQISPTERYVLFQSGNLPERGGHFKLFVLDLQTHKLVLNAPDELSERHIEWSPDGRYVAFCRRVQIGNGRTTASDHAQNETPAQLELCVFNVERATTRVVARGSSVNQFSWTPYSTLLFSRPALSSPAPSGKLPSPPLSFKAIIGPRVYEADFTHKTPRLLLNEGERTSISPNKRWIAYFGPLTSIPKTEKDPTAAEDEKVNGHSETREVMGDNNAPQLCLADRTTKLSFPVKPIVPAESVTPVFWTADNCLIVVRFQRNQAGESASISAFSPQTRQWKELATLQAGIPQKDFPEAPLFIRSRLSGTRQTLFVSSVEVWEHFGSLVSGAVDWRSVNLSSGKVQRITRIFHASGLDIEGQLSNSSERTVMHEEGNHEKPH